MERFSSSFFGAMAAVCALVIIGVAIGVSFFVTQEQITAAKNASAAQSSQFEAHLCRTLDTVKALQPPPGNPNTNPSRAYDQQEHAALAQLAADLGCPAIPALGK
jgi:hypothetical protein